MQNTIRIIAAGWVMAFAPLMSTYAQTAYEGSSNIQLLYGEGFEPDNIPRTTLTLDQAGTYGLFEHSGFTDVYYNTDTDATSAHLEWYPKISLGRASGWTVGAGPLEGILVGGGINADLGTESDGWVWLAGPVLDFNIPGFDSFRLETYYYRQADRDGNRYEGTYQITPNWDIPLPVTQQLHFRFSGFVDFIGDRGPGTHQIITQPQFLLDLGNLWNEPDRIYAGTEWYYIYNKGGVDGVEESVFQLELQIVF